MQGTGEQAGAERVAKRDRAPHWSEPNREPKRMKNKRMNMWMFGQFGQIWPVEQFSLCGIETKTWSMMYIYTRKLVYYGVLGPQKILEFRPNMKNSL